ncbi:twin-arginine translocase subunit TatC [Microbacterium dextranolyticum]|uniref:Sec-independent protein translocase protein TatC n=1 Tax=Microbacterium dextranolyticum TaxID=36806 RepID=A0A9W6HM87_9MICO|nr:twin-arginine translocase subunit TatC [Microbacterium dextranolyticum]MBM7463098.1 sec-independent protein translocase protein TatC [Microbacterium dextranolyticum]GLJ95796.1 Sec-independent protein translocase protein TatC [Microbacterium dextranolyticum]
MSLAQHLGELRKRIVIALIALVVGMVVAYFLTDWIIWAMTEPIRVVAAQRGMEDKVGLMYQTVTGPFDMRLRISFVVGIIISAPVWLWQLWAFLMPGLTRKEIQYTIGFVAAAVPLFFAGCYVGWWVMPHIVELMATFTPEGAANWFDSKYYYDFVFKLIIVVGVSFVVPVFLVALNLAGIMSGRAILKAWRVAVLIAVGFAGLATPAADIVSMLMLAGILVVLFFAAAGLSMLFDRRRAKRSAAALKATL